MIFKECSAVVSWFLLSWWCIFLCVQKIMHILLYYRVSQQVWNGLKTMFWYSDACERSELRFGKNVFCSLKLLFQPFLWTAKLKMEFLSNCSPIILCSNLFSRLLEIGEKLLKNPFLILQFTKKAEKAILRSIIQTFFCKRCLLCLQTFLSWFQTCWDTWYKLYNWHNSWFSNAVTL